MPPQKTIRRQLAELTADINFENLPPEVIKKAKLCILDLVGVSISGSQQKITQTILEVLGRGYEIGVSTLWGTNNKFSVETAAMLNAFQGHVIDMDDGHRYANGHPGVVTIPTAIACSEEKNLSGKKILESIVVGYEIFITLGTYVNPNLLLNGFHTTSVIGTLTSAAVSSKLLGLSIEETENAFSLAALQSSGLLEALACGETGKALQVSRAVNGGVLSSLLAQKGADGPELIFEGEKGFFQAFADMHGDGQLFIPDSNKSFSIESTYFKKHATCRHIHPVLDAISEIASTRKLNLKEIAAIEIETYSIAYKLTGHLSPQDSVLGAKFSMPVAIGLMLVFGYVDQSAFNSQHISDVGVQSIAKKVKIIASHDCDKSYPEKRTARVTILTNNNSYNHEIFYPKGEPENPLSDQDLIQKYNKNAHTVYSENKLEEIKNTIFDLENKKSAQLVELLTAP